MDAIGEGKVFDEGKPDISLVDPDFIRQIAFVLGKGAEKYGARNYEKGLPHLKRYNSAMRHLLSWRDGEDLDPETGLSHLHHAATNLMILAHLSREFPEGDNRDVKRTPTIEPSEEVDITKWLTLSGLPLQTI